MQIEIGNVAYAAATDYLPNLTTNSQAEPSGYITNSDAAYVGAGFIKSGDLYFKLNKVSHEAIIIGYNRQSLSTSITIPETISFSTDNVGVANSSFVGTYTIRYIGRFSFFVSGVTTNLTSITLPNTILVIGGSAFEGQCKIEEFTIPDSVTDIGQSAFESMNSSSKSTNCLANIGLKKLIIGSGFTRSSVSTFARNSLLASIIFRGSAANFTSPTPDMVYPPSYELWQYPSSTQMYVRAPSVNWQTCSNNFSYSGSVSIDALSGSSDGWATWATSCLAPGKPTVNAVVTTPFRLNVPSTGNITKNSVSVSFISPSNNGGSAILDYTVSSFPDGRTVTRAGADGGTVVVSGLSPSTSYTFKVTARNSVGSSIDSPSSVAVTTLLDVTYPVVFDSQGATTAESGGSRAYSTGSPISIIPSTSPQKIGYTFIGWNTFADGTGEAVTSNSYTPPAPYSAITIYAKWSADPHHVTYNLNGGDSSLPTQVDVVTAGAFTTAATPTKSNYTFSGWSNGATSTAASTSYTMGTSDLTLTAQWTPAFQVTFISAGSVANPLTFSSTALSKPSDPTRSGYSFSMWQDSSGTEITWPFTPTGPIELTAVWSANSYLVTYVYNGATSDTSTVTSAFTTGDATPISLPSPQKTGYNFGGWYGEIGLTNQIGLAGATYSPTGATTAISLFAKWIINTYSVTYTAGANGSITGTSSQTINHGSNATLVTATPAANHHFVSWSDNVLTAVRTDLNVVSNLSVSATFAIDTVTVTYNPNGGVVDTATVTANFGGTVNLSTATWVGYHFDGWYDLQVGGNLVSTDFQASANRQLWARWTQLSLYGIPSLDLNQFGFVTSSTLYEQTLIARLNVNTSSTINVPAGAFLNDTRVEVYTLPNDNLAKSKVSPNDSYIISQVVAWHQIDDNSVKNALIPIEMIITSPLIKKGAVVYSVLGDEVTVLGRATVDGIVTVQLKRDPAVIVAMTKPGAPTSVTASNGANTSSIVSWSAPLEDGGSAITGYSVTSSPSVTPPAGCTNVNATSCTFTGLTNGTSYRFRVVAINAIGTSETSAVSSSITPLDPIQAPAFTMSSSTETVVLGGALVGYTITSTGGAIASYAISPVIGNGLSFSTSTGLISGTPSNVATAVVYTVSAHNASSPDASQTFTLTVTAPTPAPTPAPSGGGGGGGSVYVASTPDPAIAIAEAAKAKAAAEKIAAEAKAAADLKAAQEKAAAEAAQAAALKAAQELADAQAKADAELKAAQDKALEDARIAEELRLAQEKAEADLREAAEKKAAEDAAAAALLAAKKIVPNVTLYSISNSLKLSTYDSSYLKKYVSKLKPNAKVTCVGYVYTKNTTYAKAKLLASKQAKSVCALIKKQKKTIITSTLLYPSSMAPKAAAGAKWVAVSYRVDGYKS